jgi:glutamine synthetase
MSVFLGSQLSSVLDELEEKVKSGKMTPDEKTALKLNIGKIPDILLDNTDRNRTSPFAFTGNKFEFRAVGSSANCSGAMTVLNTIMADQLVQFKKDVDALMAKGKEKDEAIFHVLRDYIVASKRIRFEGNGYGEEWVKEAKKRGLSNMKTTPEALAAWMNKNTVKMFERHNVLTDREQHARYEIYLETYVKKIQIEARVMGDLAVNNIIPTALQYQNTLISNVQGLKAVLGAASFKKAAEVQLEMIEEISTHVNGIKKSVDAMIEERKKANNIDDMEKKAAAYCNKVKAYFDTIRDHVDKLEMIVSDDAWPLPKYRELLFTK